MRENASGSNVSSYRKRWFVLLEIDACVLGAELKLLIS